MAKKKATYKNERKQVVSPKSVNTTPTKGLSNATASPQDYKRVVASQQSYKKGVTQGLRLFHNLRRVRNKSRRWLRSANQWRISKVVNFKAWGHSAKKLWQPIKEIIQEKHRFVVMDSKTYKEKLSFQLSGINLFVTIGVSMLVLIVLTSLLISFTSLREFIPGYANTKMVEQTYRNAHVIDSLERQLNSQSLLLHNIQQMLNGEEMPGEEALSKPDTASKAAAVNYTRSKEDSILRREVEQEDNKYQLKHTSSTAPKPTSEASSGERYYAVSERVGLSAQLLFPPLKGKVIGEYDAKLNHYGVDIAGAANATIVAAYSGTVIFANYTVETGYVIAVQHPGNVISVYKHCSALLQQQGNMVRAGEPIAYLGNTGKLTTGPHLHFELWMGGKPINPTQYVSF